MTTIETATVGEIMKEAVSPGSGNGIVKVTDGVELADTAVVVAVGKPAP
jgi:hypothetical protein